MSGRGREGGWRGGVDGGGGGGGSEEGGEGRRRKYSIQTVKTKNINTKQGWKTWNPFNGKFS